jgi:hypothetical protein
MKRAASLSIFSIFLFLLGIAFVLTGMYRYQHEQPFIAFELDSLNAEYQLSYEGKCIFPFVLKNLAPQGIELEASLVGNKEIIKDRFFFNDIGQLYRAYIMVTTGGKSIHIELSGVQQIHVKISGNLFQNPFSVEHNVDGPIVLLEERNRFILRIPFKKRVEGSSLPLESLIIERRNPNQMCDGTIPVLPSIPPFATKLLESLTNDEVAQ